MLIGKRINGTPHQTFREIIDSVRDSRQVPYDFKLRIMREYESLKELRGGNTLILEGMQVIMLPGEIEVGDWYVAERNTGPHLLTAREIVKNDSMLGGWIHPNEIAYSFDLSECVRVKVLGL